MTGVHDRPTRFPHARMAAIPAAAPTRTETETVKELEAAPVALPLELLPAALTAPVVAPAAAEEPVELGTERVAGLTLEVATVVRLLYVAEESIFRFKPFYL